MVCNFIYSLSIYFTKEERWFSSLKIQEPIPSHWHKCYTDGIHQEHTKNSHPCHLECEELGLVMFLQMIPTNLSRRDLKNLHGHSTSFPFGSNDTTLYLHHVLLSVANNHERVLCILHSLDHESYVHVRHVVHTDDLVHNCWVMNEDGKGVGEKHTHGPHTPIIQAHVQSVCVFLTDTFTIFNHKS